MDRAQGTPLNSCFQLIGRPARFAPYTAPSTKYSWLSALMIALAGLLCARCLAPDCPARAVN